LGTVRHNSQFGQEKEGRVNHKHWYALYTKPNAEYQVASVLDSRGIEVFLPTVKSFRPRRGHLDEPFFPSYLFIRVNLTEVGFPLIQWTPGLRWIVTFGGKPVAVPDEAIEFIRAQLDELDGQGGLPNHGFKPGDRVRIVSGPLRGLHAIFEGPKGPAERVRILVNFLGRLNRTEIPVSDLEKVPSQTERPRRRRTRGRGRRIRYAH